MVELRQLFPQSPPKPQTSSQGTITPLQVVTPTAESYYRAQQQAQAPIVLTGTTTVQQKQEAERVVSTVPSREEVAQRYPGQGLEQYHYLIVKKPGGVGWDITAAQKAKFQAEQGELAAREPLRTEARAANVERQQAVQRVYEDIQTRGYSTEASRAAYSTAAEREVAATSRYAQSQGITQPRLWTTISAAPRTAAAQTITSISAPVTVAEVSQRYGTQYKGYEGLITRTPAGGMDLRLADAAKMADYEVGLAQAYPARTAAHAALAERQAAVQSVYDDIQTFGFSRPETRAKYKAAEEKEYQATLLLPREAATVPRPGAGGAPRVEIVPGASAFSRSLGVTSPLLEARTAAAAPVVGYEGELRIPVMPAADARTAYGAVRELPLVGMAFTAYDIMTKGGYGERLTSPTESRRVGGIFGITPETAPGIAKTLTTLPVVGGLFAAERSALEWVARPRETTAYTQYRTSTEKELSELTGVQTQLGAAKTRFETTYGPQVTELKSVQAELATRTAGYATDAQGRIIVPKEDVRSWELYGREQELLAAVRPGITEYETTTAPLIARQAELRGSLATKTASAEAAGVIKQVEGGYVPGKFQVATGFQKTTAAGGSLDVRLSKYTGKIGTEAGMDLWRTGTQRMYETSKDIGKIGGPAVAPAIALYGLAAVSGGLQRTATEVRERPYSTFIQPAIEAAAMSYALGGLSYAAGEYGLGTRVAAFSPRLARAGELGWRALPYALGGAYAVTSGLTVAAAPAAERPQVATRELLKGAAFLGGWEAGQIGWRGTVAAGRATTAAVRTVAGGTGTFETARVRGFYSGGGPGSIVPGQRVMGVEVRGVGRVGYASGGVGPTPTARQFYMESWLGRGAGGGTAGIAPRPTPWGGATWYDGAGYETLGGRARLPSGGGLPAVVGETLPGTIRPDMPFVQPIYYLPPPPPEFASIVTTSIARTPVSAFTMKDWGAIETLPGGKPLGPEFIATWPGAVAPTALGLFPKELPGPGVVREPSKLPSMYESIARTWPEYGYGELQEIGAQMDVDIRPVTDLPTARVPAIYAGDIGGAKIVEILPYTSTVTPLTKPTPPPSTGMMPIIGGGIEIRPTFAETYVKGGGTIQRPVYFGGTAEAVTQRPDYVYGPPAIGKPVTTDIGRFTLGGVKDVWFEGGDRVYRMKSGEIYRTTEKGGRIFISRVGEGITGAGVTPVDWTAGLEMPTTDIDELMYPSEIPTEIPRTPEVTIPAVIGGELPATGEVPVLIPTEVDIPVEITPEIEVPFEPTPTVPIEEIEVIPPWEEPPPFKLPSFTWPGGESQFEQRRRRKGWFELLPLESPLPDMRISRTRLPRSVLRSAKPPKMPSAAAVSKAMGMTKAAPKKKGGKRRRNTAKDILGEMGW